ncbi:probable G-protein coupled receptor 33 [Pleurodeles waltl]|uniref:probable G-protein coupled receptor 33 n=1 Tax=Pleurodeles waltl TaxID=8319 RepID=UPI00370965CB
MEAVRLPQLLTSLFFMATFFIAFMVNSLYIWTLGFKMTKTVSSIWILHLIMTSWIFTILLPIFSVTVLMDMHWVLGKALCKIISGLGLLCMYASVIILMIISLDRYVLVIHPLSVRSCRTIKRSKVICGAVWILAFLLSIPELVFMDTKQVEKNRTFCFRNYALSENWDSPEANAIRQKNHWAMFIFQFIFGFILPFMVICYCYITIAMKMKMKKLNKSKKPFQVIMAAIVSFFVCWIPYHLYHGLTIYKEEISKVVVYAMYMVSAILCCVNVCCTPILYLFIGENFKEVFKKSILTLIEKAFNEDLNSIGGSKEKTLELSVSAVCERRMALEDDGKTSTAALEAAPNMLTVPCYTLSR